MTVLGREYAFAILESRRSRSLRRTIAQDNMNGQFGKIRVSQKSHVTVT